MSCKKKLDYVPESYLSPEQVYNDESGCRAGIIGIYRQLAILKQSELGTTGIIGTDEGKTTNFVKGWGTYWYQLYAINSYDKIQFGSQNDNIYYFWQRCYVGINNANMAIRYIPNAPIGETVKTQLIAEAKFLRAVFYSYLVQLFGAVPMPTDTPNPKADENGYPRTPAQDVYALIVADLKYATDNLPGKAAQTKGHVNKEAAQTLLGRTYLTLKDYPNAKTNLEAVVNSPNTKLMDNFEDLYVEANENNIESLFEIEYNSESGYTQSLSNLLGSWNIGNKLPGGGGQTIINTPYAVTVFSTPDSIRKKATFRLVYYDANGNPGLNDWWEDVGKPHIKKYEQKSGQSADQFSRNIYYLRFADALLLYAETLNEQGQTGQALTYLNKVRNRAKLVNWETELGHQPSQQEFRNELVLERMRELCFEGWRWFDLKRWGLLVSRTKAYNTDAAPNITDTNLLFPIPYREFSNNRTLDRTKDQNPGY